MSPKATTNGSYASKQQIIDAEDLKREDLFIPEWNLTVLVWELTGGEYAEYQKRLSTLRQEIRGRGKRRNVDFVLDSHVERAMLELVALSLKDERGVRLFSDAEIAELGAKAMRPIRRIYEVAERLSGLDEDMEEALAGKDSEQIHGSSDGSSSPETTDTELPVSSSTD